MSFLKAEWRRLAIANFEVNPSVLARYVPYKTELDTWNGICYISLVGFLFKNTRLLGWAIPGYIDFEEINLRFYVRYKEENGWKRGVVFIKEIVPRPAISFIANTIYHEHYQTCKMQHTWAADRGMLHTGYRFKYNNKWQSFSLNSTALAQPVEENSETEFITEHYWGFTRAGKNKTIAYEVTHPKWNVYTVLNYKIEVDFNAVYGTDFSFLNLQAPLSCMLAEGSEITVENKQFL